MAQKPSVPKGTRDFSPMEMARRNYIFDTIRNTFRLFGYEQIETPAQENLSTLMGKYGDEGDKLLFKILDSGDFAKNLTPEDLNGSLPSLTKKISEKGLRYDLTVPFARYVVQHRNDIQTPFKRFQIQPVWRADRPQKGRYREFYQCDADIVGSTSLLNEVELLQLLDSVFAKFKINITIKLNNRKVLAGIAEILGEEERLTDITVAIDKIDKIGLEGVQEEMRSKGVSEDAIRKMTPILELQGDNISKLDAITDLLKESETGLKGVEELREVISVFDSIGHTSDLELDLSLARGLNYYTGCIIEVKANDVEIGSISGGGRYDNLTGVFGVDGLSGVGISFGADRIYDVLNQLELYPESLSSAPQIIFLNLGKDEAIKSLKIIKDLRSSGITAMLYPDASKMKKQMAYANVRQIPFVGIIGEEELQSDLVTIKNMITGEQMKICPDQLTEHLH